MIYAITVIFAACAVLAICSSMYIKNLEKRENDIAEQIIREHFKEIQELKRKRFYE
jgi:hypothetical protein